MVRGLCDSGAQGAVCSSVDMGQTWRDFKDQRVATEGWTQNADVYALKDSTMGELSAKFSHDMEVGDRQATLAIRHYNHACSTTRGVPCATKPKREAATVRHLPHAAVRVSPVFVGCGTTFDFPFMQHATAGIRQELGRKVGKYPPSSSRDQMNLQMPT